MKKWTELCHQDKNIPVLFSYVSYIRENRHEHELTFYVKSLKQIIESTPGNKLLDIKTSYIGSIPFIHVLFSSAVRSGTKLVITTVVLAAKPNHISICWMSAMQSIFEEKEEIFRRLNNMILDTPLVV